MEFLGLKYFKISNQDTQAGWSLLAPGWASGSAVTRLPTAEWRSLTPAQDRPSSVEESRGKETFNHYSQNFFNPRIYCFFSPFLLGIKGSKTLNIMTMSLPGSKSVSNIQKVIVLELYSHLESPDAGLWSFMRAHSTSWFVFYL